MIELSNQKRTLKLKENITAIECIICHKNVKPKKLIAYYIK